MKFLFFCFWTLLAGAEEFETARFETLRTARTPGERLALREQFDQFEVLRLACERELQLQRPPTACFRALGARPKSVTWNGPGKERLIVQCRRWAPEATVLPPPEDWVHLPETCRQAVEARYAILEYKREGGRKFE